MKNLNDVASEICKREKSDKREVNITDVKRVLRHLSDLMAEAWTLNYDLKIGAALRQKGMRRIKNKKKH